MSDRDLRDPQAVGEAIQKGMAHLRGVMPAHEVADEVNENPQWTPPYRDGPFMSSDPREHHSKTPQHIDLWDGGE